MGVKRTVQKGEKDSLGREIMISGQQLAGKNNAESRAAQLSGSSWDDMLDSYHDSPDQVEECLGIIEESETDEDLAEFVESDSSVLSVAAATKSVELGLYDTQKAYADSGHVDARKHIAKHGDPQIAKWTSVYDDDESVRASAVPNLDARTQDQLADDESTLVRSVVAMYGSSETVNKMVDDDSDVVRSMVNTRHRSDFPYDTTAFSRRPFDMYTLDRGYSQALMENRMSPNNQSELMSDMVRMDKASRGEVPEYDYSDVEKAHLGEASEAIAYSASQNPYANGKTLETIASINEAPATLKNVASHPNASSAALNIVSRNNFSDSDIMMAAVQNDNANYSSSDVYKTAAMHAAPFHNTELAQALMNKPDWNKWDDEGTGLKERVERVARG